MTVEELLKPRWKVIADFPGSPFEVGYISEWREFDMGDHTYDKIDYPDIFKKLEWWEDRDEEDLPNCVRKIDCATIYRVFWDKIHQQRNTINVWPNRKGFTVNFKGIDQDFSLLKQYQPATEEEYENQK